MGVTQYRPRHLVPALANLVLLLLLALSAQDTFAFVQEEDTNAEQANLSSGKSRNYVSAPSSVSPDGACGPGANYVVTQTGGATIVPGTSLVPGSQCDECSTTITLPFVYTLYGVTYSTASIGENGTLSFGNNANPYGNYCLPRPAFDSAILPHWDDLTTELCVDPSLGVYASLSGSAPQRIFNLEWRACRYAGTGSCGGYANFEVRLYESDTRFDIIYGQVSNTGSSATIGVQKDAGSQFTQYQCNVAGSVQQGMQLAFVQPSCGSPTLTPTPPTSTRTATPVSSVTNTPPGTSTPRSTSTPTVACALLPAPSQGGKPQAPVTIPGLMPEGTSSLPGVRPVQVPLGQGTFTPTVTDTPPAATNTATATRTPTATSTPCGVTGAYQVATGTGTIVPGTLDIGNHSDDLDTLVALPFTYNLYDHSYTSVNVSSNGRLDFAAVNEPGGYTNACLPPPANLAPFDYVIFPYWDDQLTTPAPTHGIFTSISGSAPNRIFNIEWRTCLYNAGSCGGELNYEVRLYEGQNRFEIIYGTLANAGTSATVGVQGNGTINQYTQYECNTGGLTAGMMLTFTQLPCGTPVPTATATRTVSSTPTNTSTNTPTNTPPPGTFSATSTNTPTSTQTSGITASATPSNTAITGTHTTTRTATPTATPASSPPTETPTRLPTNTPTNTPTAVACGPNSNYNVVTATPTFVPGTRFVPGSHCDDCILGVTPPFEYSLYGQPYSTFNVSANGNIQFASGDNSYRQLCLGAPTFGNAIFPYWTDLDMSDACGPDCGVYTSVTGTAPNRIFNVEWRAVLKDDPSNHNNFEVRLYEGQKRFDIVYAQIDTTNSNVTIGVRGNVTFRTTQFACSARPVIPAAAQLTFVQPDCVCTINFTDVHLTDYFYEPVRVLFCMGAISGYGDNTFRPYNNTTRGQLTKIIVNAEGWSINTASGPHFIDVAPDSAFYAWIETAYSNGIISGYNCGSPGEPCPGLYFRPNANVTRAQLTKIIVSAEGWSVNTAGGPHFVDVPTGHPFYGYIETAYLHSLLSGYNCGSPGEPCPGLYLRPGANATRGQIAKIVYNAISAP